MKKSLSFKNQKILSYNKELHSDWPEDYNKDTPTDWREACKRYMKKELLLLADCDITFSLKLHACVDLSHDLEREAASKVK